MKLRPKYLFLILFCSLLFASTSTLASLSPTEALRPTLQGMIDVLRDPALAGEANKDARRQMIMAIAASGFDFKEMSKRVLGKTWRKLNGEQRVHFELLFTKLLENAYVGKLEEYSGQVIHYKDERIKGNKAAVATIVTSTDTPPLPVSYVMLNKGNGWQVYDMNIEGVSFLRNYREQFRSILRKDKFDGLVKILEKKNASFTQGTSK